MNTQSVLPTPSPAQPLMTAGTFANLYGDDAPMAGTPAAIAPATTRRTETVRAARPCTAGQSEAAHGQPEEADADTESTARPMPSRTLGIGEVLLQAGETGAIWQLNQGLVRLEAVTADGASFVRLALPGDLLGAESALHQPYTFRAVAVTDCRVTQVDASSDMQRMLILMTAFLQEQDRAVDAMRMRQGPVGARLDHLLQVLDTGMNDDEPVSVRHRKLPQLRDLAFIIDSTPESACRYLTRHLGLHRQRRYRRSNAVQQADTQATKPAGTGSSTRRKAAAPAMEAMAD